jgi:hypothetical protein
MTLLVGSIVVWLAIWFAVWRIFYGPMAGRQINYVDRYPWTCVYFLGLAVLVVFLFRGTLTPPVEDVTAGPVAVLAGTILVQVLLYYLAVRYLRRPVQLIEDNPREMFLRFDYRYLVSKSFEVLFQQVMVVLVVMMAWKQTGSLVKTVIIFAVVFALAHLPLLKIYGSQTGVFAKIYLAASLVSAVIFPVVILKVNLGFVYTYAVHSMFFTVLALWFWRQDSKVEPR